MSWFFLISATFLDVLATFFMKRSDGFSKLIPTFWAVITFGLSLFALAVALKKLDVISVYTVWVGLGMVLISLLGWVVFRESLSLLKMMSMLLVVVGVIGLVYSSELRL